LTTAERRLVILAEGNFGFHHGKTAMGVIRYGRDRVMAVIDSTQAGRNVREWLGDSGRYDIPIVASLSDALGLLPRANALLVGIAPTGGRLPDDWRPVILSAIRLGLDVHAGLHTFLADDPEFASAAESAGVRLVDHRRTSEPPGTAVGRRHLPGKRVILTVGTDCAVGKMSVAIELTGAATAAGRPAVFVPTGQTGIMIEGWGLAVDRVISDFLQGAVEQLVADGEGRGDWLIVEGQGSLDHPAYSSVTLGLIHGATPDAMVLVHQPGLQEHDFEHVPEASFPIADLGSLIAAHEIAARLVTPSKVVAIALNTSGISDPGDARRIIAATEAETGLPADDPVRFGAGALWGRIEAAVEALPWVIDRATDRLPVPATEDPAAVAAADA
jgi:D-glutamate N-acetyltransferase